MADTSPAKARTPEASVLSLRLSTMFGALFVIHGVQLTYLPVWLDARGLSSAEIALATSAPMFLRLIATPGVAFLADRSADHRRYILRLCWTALILMLALAQSSTGLLIIVLVALMQTAVSTIMPLLDTITLSAARSTGLDYGRVRLWGSLTFIFASYAAGYTVAAGGAGAIIGLLIAGAALTTAAAIVLPRRDRTVEARPGARLTLGDVVDLARDRRFVLFLLCSGAIQASHAMFYVFGVLHWRGQGLSAGYIGTLWAIGVVAEIALFWAARRLALLGAVELMLLGAAAGVVRWTIMAFDPPSMLLAPLQVLHAGTFAATHLGAMQWISAKIPERQAGTAQALSSTINAGIAMGGAMLASGPLYAHLGGFGYVAMAALCAVGIVSGLVLRRT